jgi:hypothetical protein
VDPLPGARDQFGCGESRKQSPRPRGILPNRRTTPSPLPCAWRRRALELPSRRRRHLRRERGFLHVAGESRVAHPRPRLINPLERHSGGFFHSPSVYAARGELGHFETAKLGAGRGGRRTICSYRPVRTADRKRPPVQTKGVWAQPNPSVRAILVKCENKKVNRWECKEFQWPAAAAAAPGGYPSRFLRVTRLPRFRACRRENQ